LAYLSPYYLFEQQQIWTEKKSYIYMNFHPNYHLVELIALVKRN